MRGLLVALRVLGAEGPRGFSARLCDRLALERRARSYRRVSPSGLPRGFPCLNLLAVPPSPRFGGVPAQLVARLREEARARPVALLWRDGGTLRLDLESGDERVSCSFPAPGGDRPEVERPEVESLVAELAGRIGASVVHVEGTSGWPALGLSRLAGRGLTLVVSLHDFSLFCPRPHLVEEPGETFCGYSTDDARCARCLSASWDLGAGGIGRWREAGERLLGAASAVVYPSGFLARRTRALFGGERAKEELVVPPAVPLDALPPRPAPRGPVRHVAFVGAYEVHKGARVFAEALGTLDEDARRSARFSVLGGGDAALLTEARRLGATVRGFYPLGNLPRLLRREEVDLALLLSIWPETFAMTLSECRAAGVPVLAFAHGAVAERVEAEGGGLLVGPEEGAPGIAAALSDVIRGARVPEPFRGVEAGPTPARAAAAHIALYERLGAAAGTSRGGGAA